MHSNSDIHIYHIWLLLFYLISFFSTHHAISPLATILTQNKLTGNNFIDWKRNLEIFLTVEDHAYVLTTP